MELNLTLTAAKAIFDDLDSQAETSPAYLELYEQLKPLCTLNLSWSPRGWRGLPSISGAGWVVEFNPHSAGVTGPQTTLRDLEQDGSYVLNGDHRESFAKVAEQGFAALKQTYDQLNTNPEFQTSCGTREYE